MFLTEKNRHPKPIVYSMFFEAFLTNSIIEISAVGSGLIDGIIISKMLGSFSMAAEGIAHPFYSIAGVVSGLLAVGMQTIISSYIVRGKIKEMQKTYSLVMLVAVIVSTVLSLLLFFGSDQIAFLLGARDNGASLMEEASLYLRGLAIGCIPMILCVIISCAVQIDGGSRLVQTSAIVASVTDVVCDYAAAKMGMGLFGIGLATSISYIVNFIFLMFHFLKKESLIRLDLSGLEWKQLKEICNLGSEKATRRLTNVIRPIALNAIIISAGGAMGMSALSIRNNIGNFLEIPMTGIAGATALLTGLAYGEKNAKECREVGKIAQWFIMVYCAIVLIITILGGKQIAAYYVPKEGELRKLVLFSIYFLSIGLLASSVISCRISYLQSCHQIKKTTFLTCANKLFIIVPCAFICVHIWGSYGVIASFFVSDVVLMIIIFIYYVVSKEDKRQKLPAINDYLCLPKDYYTKPQDVIELTVSNEEEAVLSAEQLKLFCDGHKIPQEKGIRAELCLEELLTNIIRVGFPMCKKVCPIEIRVTILKGDIIMVVRDKCPKYDIKQRIKAIEKESSTDSNLNIKLIAKTAKKIEYLNLLETNTILITL